MSLVKRLGIFCFYDSEGIVDEYVIYLLREMKKILARLLVVCNGNLSTEGRKLLEKISDNIIERENIGFDIEAWRQGILSCQGELTSYDELILFNDSFYGPLYPIEKIFAEMEKSDADFWGLTIHGKTEDPSGLCPYGYIPEHLQSYFLVIRARMLHSEKFLSYYKKKL